MKNLFPGLLIVGGALALLGGTDNHPPQVAASIAPAAPSVGSDNPDATTTAASSDAHVPAAVVSSEVTASARAGDDLDAAGSATAQSHAAFSSPPTLAEQMLEAANRLGPYRTLDPTLCQAAQDYADYLAEYRQQGHYADGTPPQRVARAGFTGSLEFNERLGNWYYDGRSWKRERVSNWGEVLAFGHPDVDSAFRGWMASTGHKEAVLESSFDVAGFGKAKDAPIYVGIFGNSQATPVTVAAAKAVQVEQPSGRWVTVEEPTYGPFGRQRGTQTVTRWQGPPRQQPQPMYTQPYQPYQMKAYCSGPGCSSGGHGFFRGR